MKKIPALTRRFQLVKLEEPTIHQAVDILRGLNSVYEKAHNVLITDDALKAAAELSARYISGRQLPDKAIDVLDTACARIAINMTTTHPNVWRCSKLRVTNVSWKLTCWSARNTSVGKSIMARLDELRTQELADEAEKASLTASWQQQKALIESIIALRAELMAMSTADDVDEDARSALQADLAAQYQALEAIAHHERLMHPQVDAEQIAEVIADWTGVPVDQMNTDELYKITHLTDILGAANQRSGHCD